MFIDNEKQLQESLEQASTYFIEGRYGESLAVYEKLLEIDAETKSNYWYLGICQLLQGKVEQAKITWFNFIKDIRIEHGDVDLLKRELNDILETEANRLEELQDYQNSLVIRNCLLEVSPHNLNNRICTIILFIKSGSFISQNLLDLDLLDAHKLQSFIRIKFSVISQLLETIFVKLSDYDYLTLEGVENICLLYSDYKLEIANKLCDLSIFLNENKRWDDAIQCVEIGLKINSENLNLYKQKIDLYIRKDSHKAVVIARELEQLSQNRRLIDRVSAYEWLTRALIVNCSYWKEARQSYGKYEDSISQLTSSQSINISTDEAFLYLLTTGFYSQYFSDNPRSRHDLFKNVRQLASQKIEVELNTNISNYKKRLFLRKKYCRLNLPIKIGYISTCFRRHSVGYLARWLIQNHDRQRFELYGYMGESKDSDLLRSWYIEQFYKVNTNSQKDIVSLANQIQCDGIDILIDLDSITSAYGTALSTLKAAPIHITWLGWDAVGLQNIDYFIADPYVLPEDADEYYTEKIWRLPQTYIAVDGFESSTPTVRRDTLDIPADAVIYFSAQASMKRHPDTIRLQMRIVKSVPNSYLVLKSMGDQESLKEFFYQMAEAEGVEKERLRFLPITNSEAEHRANLILADVVLDTYPYNGATHTLETLWMGIPMVTRVGKQFAARNSYTMMINAGITEGIAWTDEEYVEWGIRLGTDHDLRNQVILKLRQGKQTAPLWNSRQFTRDMETAYEQMWQIWLDAEDPDIEIDPVADRELFIAEAELRNQDAIRLAQNGKLDSAIACWQAAISLHPEYIDAYYNMGIAQFQSGQLDQAVESFQITIELKSDHANALYSLGLVLVRQNKLDEAIFTYDQAFAINPEDIDIPLAMGSAFFKQGEWETAITAYQTALEINAESVTALIGLGASFMEYGELEEAIACLQSALAINPNDAKVYCNLGYTFAKAKQMEDAAFCYKKALHLDCHLVDAYWSFNNDILSDSNNSLHYNFKLRREIADQFLESCHEKEKIRPTVNFISNYIHSGLSDIAVGKLPQLEEFLYKYANNIEDIEVEVLYNSFIFILSSLRDNRDLNTSIFKLIGLLYQERVIKSKLEIGNSYARNREISTSNRPLKIGFLSPHFARHPVGWCSLDVIRELSKITPHIYLYTTGTIQPDEHTEKFEQIAETYYWYENEKFNFDGRIQQLVSDITKDKLDVIIDLDSVTIPLNTHILCREHLAPIRLSWLGFDAPFISPNNYWLGDRFTHPEGIDEHYVEKILRLPDAHMSVSGFESIEIDRDIEREKLGIASDQVAYLYAAPARKFNRDSARACISIMQQVPNSVLLHKGSGDQEVIGNIYEEICDEMGIAKERVRFLPSYKTEEEHRGIYAIADVFLDSYPYNGGSHNLEVLWFNLPVVTRVGEQSFARMGYSFLQALNINEGIAYSWEEYIDCGVRYGLDTNLRNSVKQQLIDSKKPDNLAPLWNPQKLAHDMYNLLKKLISKS